MHAVTSPPWAGFELMLVDTGIKTDRLDQQLATLSCIRPKRPKFKIIIICMYAYVYLTMRSFFSVFAIEYTAYRAAPPMYGGGSERVSQKLIGRLLYTMYTSILV